MKPPGLEDVNALVQQSAILQDFVSRPDLLELLKDLQYDWASGLVNANSQVFSLWADQGYIEGTGTDARLTLTGKLFLSRLVIHFPRLADNKTSSLTEKYEEFRLLSAGKNAIVMVAQHRLLKTPIVLKILRPGSSVGIKDSISLLGRITEETALVLPTDFFSAHIVDALGRPLDADCIAFPFVRGSSFREFLRRGRHYLNAQVAIAFATQVGTALAALESVGAYHGDFSEGNILVDEDSEEGLRFRVVDISFGSMGSLPREWCVNSDLVRFKQHVWRILGAQRAFMPRMSLRKYLGTRSFLTIIRLLSDEVETFSDVIETLGSDSEYKAYLAEKERFVSEKFPTPMSFRLQRYEEITDHAVAVKLFVPFEELMTKIAAFGNLYVAGNRGSGKSTYLASLAYYADAPNPLVDVAKTFGVYFPCRQGEFKSLLSRAAWNRDLSHAVVTRLVLIKVIRTTLSTILTGFAVGRLTEPSSITPLKTIVEEVVGQSGIVSVARGIQSEVDNLISSMARVEMNEIAELPLLMNSAKLNADLRVLLRFFGVLRTLIPELAGTQFHLLFDDAGVPYVPANVQEVLSDLMLLSNPLFCTKVSAEKLTFDFISSDGKHLEAGHDYLEHDISQVLFIGSIHSGLRRSVLEAYFREIVDQRLEYFGYLSHDIIDYVGDKQFSTKILTERLAMARKDAFYFGWTAIWNVADRTPRNLLEIVSEILAAGGVDRNTTPDVVSRFDQHRAIRTISEKRLDSLSQIAGTISVGGKAVSLGARLFEVTTAIGSTFRKYLRSEAGRPTVRQHLAIERNDLGELSPEAEQVLQRLITFGILDATKLEIARDDEARKPIYVLNRIYCPAFSISFRRDDHLRLSRNKFETLLLSPGQFLRSGTSKLSRLADGGEEDLFTYRDNLS